MRFRHRGLRGLCVRPGGSRAPVARVILAVSLAVSFLAGSVAAQAQDTGAYAGRPIYSEPGAGLQLPPNCLMEPTWRQRLGSSDLEVWVVNCGGTPRTWFLRRSLLEMVGGNQARLRFQVLDDRAWPGESAGDSLSVQCTSRSGNEAAGYVVMGAKWKAAGPELRLAGAANVIRADAASQKFVPATLGQVECVRYPEREAMMRRLNKSR